MGTTCLVTQASTFPRGLSLLPHSREPRGSGGHHCLILAPVGVSLASCQEGSLLLSLSPFPTGMPPAHEELTPIQTAWDYSPVSDSQRQSGHSLGALFRGEAGPKVIQPEIFFFFF